MDTRARQALNALIDQLAADPATASSVLAVEHYPALAAVPEPRLEAASAQSQDLMPEGAKHAILWRSRVA
jgi:hypothetical protein